MSLVPELSDHFYNQAMNVLEGKISRGATRLSQSGIFDKDEFNFIFRMSPDVFCICDFGKLGYMYMSENVTEIMGYPLEEYYSKGLEFSFEHFAETHRNTVAEKILPGLMDYFNMYPEPGQVRFSYESLMIKASGEVRWFLHRINVLESDDEGKPLLVSEYMTDIDTIKKDNLINVIISLRNEKGTFDVIHHEKVLPSNSIISLTKQEMKILDLIAVGKSSQEIADQLYLSIHTVNNHRKNMLKKNKVRNHAELIMQAKEQKLLG